MAKVRPFNDPIYTRDPWVDGFMGGLADGALERHYRRDVVTNEPQTTRDTGLPTATSHQPAIPPPPGPDIRIDFPKPPELRRPATNRTGAGSYDTKRGGITISYDWGPPLPNQRYLDEFFAGGQKRKAKNDKKKAKKAKGRARRARLAENVERERVRRTGRDTFGRGSVTIQSELFSAATGQWLSRQLDRDALRRATRTNRRGAGASRVLQPTGNTNRTGAGATRPLSPVVTQVPPRTTVPGTTTTPATPTSTATPTRGSTTTASRTPTTTGTAKTPILDYALGQLQTLQSGFMDRFLGGSRSTTASASRLSTRSRTRSRTNTGTGTGTRTPTTPRTPPRTPTTPRELRRPGTSRTSLTGLKPQGLQFGQSLVPSFGVGVGTQTMSERCQCPKEKKPKDKERKKSCRNPVVSRTRSGDIITTKRRVQCP